MTSADATAVPPVAPIRDRAVSAFPSEERKSCAGVTAAIKTVLVTGAAQGLGLTAATLLSQREYRVILVDIQSVEAQVLRLRVGAKMLSRGSGSIVNVASISGLAAISHRSAYNASKHGLVGLTKTLAAEWGGRGVRVNAVCPGWIKTEMDTADQGAGSYSDADIVERVPLARFARPEDVAEAIAFLLDANKSGFINGISLPVDGGWLADASWNSLRLHTRV